MSVLSTLADFSEERTALQHTVQIREHTSAFYKAPPGDAGVGIECSQEMSKCRFRRENDKRKPNNLHDNILKALCPG